MKPANPIAETIVRLQTDTNFYLDQVEKNEELISQLEPLAEWAEDEEDTSTDIES
jgi:hypothetical protein